MNIKGYFPVFMLNQIMCLSPFSHTRSDLNMHFLIVSAYI